MTTDVKIWTWATFWAEISDELEIADEDLVPKERVLKWTNEGIDEAEAMINGTNQEYFLARMPPATLTNGVDTYDLPLSCFASKVRSIVINNGQRAYKAFKQDDIDKFIEYRSSRIQPATVDDNLMFMLLNTDAGRPKIVFSPVPSEGTWSYELFFYRQANRLVLDADELDIPEFAEYVFQYVRERVAWKRKPGSQAHMTEIAKLDKIAERMVKVLQDMVIVSDDEIPQDMSFYEEFDNGIV